MGSLPVNSQVNVVVVDPRNAQVVFAAGPSGVFRSTDSGLNWEPRREGLGAHAIVALVLNPNQPDTLYAAAAGGTLFRSDDGASSWRPVGR